MAARNILYFDPFSSWHSQLLSSPFSRFFHNLFVYHLISFPEIFNFLPFDTQFAPKFYGESAGLNAVCCFLVNLFFKNKRHLNTFRYYVSQVIAPEKPKTGIFCQEVRQQLLYSSISVADKIDCLVAQVLAYC